MEILYGNLVGSLLGNFDGNLDGNLVENFDPWKFGFQAARRFLAI